MKFSRNYLTWDLRSKYSWKNCISRHACPVKMPGGVGCVLLRIFGGDVRLGSPDPGPISDQNM